MEPDRAKEIIRSLADGRDPATGKPFPPESPYQQADTVRALHLALEALEKPGRTREPRVIDPTKPKAGGAWTPEEEQQLRDAFAARQPIHQMAQAHGRTPGAITARLVKLGLIEDTNLHHTGRGNAPSLTPRRQNNQFTTEPPPSPTAPDEKPENCPF